ncbi:uncharacterized protein EDB93DRAFT_1248557 [Suillus bovinus]|uniref:uncharacterized protein n=1 Tax=Suillus bovinus TaxID=48563 RepID=UPI001B875D03|nr:uncharacterized protein EDB93DRAFT_1248557 [Suillus bovinus]KAG2153657.1 hypothetical protein EDB93DRAFT_1248557 [Suillus bovinus]
MLGALYHCISKWFPAPVPPELAAQGITTGHVSTVFFFPQASLQALEGKPTLEEEDYGRKQYYTSTDSLSSALPLDLFLLMPILKDEEEEVDSLIVDDEL